MGPGRPLPVPVQVEQCCHLTGGPRGHSFFPTFTHVQVTACTLHVQSSNTLQPLRQRLPLALRKCGARGIGQARNETAQRSAPEVMSSYTPILI